MCTTSDRLLLPSRAALLQHALQEFLSFRTVSSVIIFGQTFSGCDFVLFRTTYERSCVVVGS